MTISFPIFMLVGASAMFTSEALPDSSAIPLDARADTVEATSPRRGEFRTIEGVLPPELIAAIRAADNAVAFIPEATTYGSVGIGDSIRWVPEHAYSPGPSLEPEELTHLKDLLTRPELYCDCDWKCGFAALYGCSLFVGDSLAIAITADDCYAWISRKSTRFVVALQADRPDWSRFWSSMLYGGVEIGPGRLRKHGHE